MTPTTPRDRLDEAIGPFYTNPDIGSFDGLTPETLRGILGEDLADPGHRQNEAPSTSEFLSFSERHPFVTFHGYRHQAPWQHRFSVEGIRVEPEPLEPLAADEYDRFVRDFMRFNQSADDICCSRKKGAFSWFD